MIAPRRATTIHQESRSATAGHTTLPTPTPNLGNFRPDDATQTMRHPDQDSRAVAAGDTSRPRPPRILITSAQTGHHDSSRIAVGDHRPHHPAHTHPNLGNFRP